jgi:PPP family 3-phenylpropionic acid transporter
MRPTIATLSELPVFLWAGSLLGRFGAGPLLVVSLLVFSGRMLAFSFVTVPELILPLQLLHGPSYAAMWVAGISLAKQLAPPGTGNAGQGLFAATVMGLGSACGGFVGGALYDGFGAAGMFRWMAAGLLLGLLLIAAARRPRR